MASTEPNELPDFQRSSEIGNVATRDGGSDSQKLANQSARQRLTRLVAARDGVREPEQQPASVPDRVKPVLNFFIIFLTITLHRHLTLTSRISQYGKHRQ